VDAPGGGAGGVVGGTGALVDALGVGSFDAAPGVSELAQLAS